MYTRGLFSEFYSITQRHIDQPTVVSDHFTLPANSMDNIERVPLELINLLWDVIRKARGTFLISKGKTGTLEPFEQTGVAKFFLSILSKDSLL